MEQKYYERAALLINEHLHPDMPPVSADQLKRATAPAFPALVELIKKASEMATWARDMFKAFPPMAPTQENTEGRGRLDALVVPDPLSPLAQAIKDRMGNPTGTSVEEIAADLERRLGEAGYVLVCTRVPSATSPLPDRWAPGYLNTTEKD